MGNQRTSGLTKRGGVWHVDKQFREHWNRRCPASRGVSRQAVERDPRGATQWHEGRAYVPVGRDEVSAGLPVQEAYQGRCDAFEAARSVHWITGAEAGAYGNP